MDHRAQESGKQMRFGGTLSSKSQLYLGKFSTTGSNPIKDVGILAPVFAELPPNTRDLVPHKYHLQFKERYDAMSVPEKNAHMTRRHIQSGLCVLSVNPHTEP